jgi:hypothetical protein
VADEQTLTCAAPVLPKEYSGAGESEFNANKFLLQEQLFSASASGSEKT